MKKHLALLCAAAILLMSGCSKTEKNLSSSSDPEHSETIETAVTAEATEEPERSDMLFRESSLYFEKSAEGSDLRLEQAVSGKPAQTPEEAGITLSGNLTTDDSGNTGFAYSYSMEDVSVNAFVKRKNSQENFVLIDPAYMYNIPLPSTEIVPASEYCFDLDGISINADTLLVNAKSEVIPSDKSGVWVYAEVTMDINAVMTSDSFSATGKVTKYNYLAEAETAVNVALLGDNAFESAFDEKDAAAAQTFRALLSMREDFLADDIVGVNLLDLDFDGAPEILVSRYTPPKDPNDFHQGNVDVDIYIVNKSEPTYVGTLYNSVYQVMNEGN
ncbi:MAG: hypothetical protein ACI4Q4_08460, partial [Oscillospiraceae bacterium]